MTLPDQSPVQQPVQQPVQTPTQARALFRTGATTATTSGWCRGFAQANLLAVPRDLAFDALLFAHRNPAACPLLDVTDPGDPHPRAVAPAADLRTDLPAYRIYEHGMLTAEVDDVTGFWRDDLVAFLFGCSFSFEAALAAAGVPIRHLDQGRNVSMYLTDRPCVPAGRLAGPLVVSMRPVPERLVDAAIAVSSRFPSHHGPPVHVGDPAALGIADLSRPDFGDPADFALGDVPVFWACGVTPQAVCMAAKPEFAITHSPGRMFITDIADHAAPVDDIDLDTGAG
jgi:uncharacterized protein YcsI (UPF0317 family)